MWLEGLHGFEDRIELRARSLTEERVEKVPGHQAIVRARVEEQEHKAGETLRFYGELNQFRERWQFVIHDASWVK